MDQREAPLVGALQAYGEEGIVPFHTPGHKQGRAAPSPLDRLWGPGPWQMDLTEVPGLDDLHDPRGVIDRAQKLAAGAFGAEETFFLVNGSSGGIIAALLALCSPGDEIILPRHCHRSVLAGLILSGAVPRYLAPEISREFGIPWGVSAAGVEEALRRYPRARAVLVVNPSYYGICADLEAIVKVAHRYRKPLVVDEAHGPHLAFHPALPQGAVAAGADLVVQSTHKVLTSLTQSSLLHVQGSHLDRDRLRQMLRIVQTSSPSYLLLASLDACRRQMALQGEELLDRALILARQVRGHLRGLPGLQVLEEEDLLPNLRLDPLKLTVGIWETGYRGPEAAKLLAGWGVGVELADPVNLLFLLTLADGGEEGERLVNALTGLASAGKEAKEVFSFPSSLPLPPVGLPPREAAFAPSERVPLSQAEGRLAAGAVVPSPPGIPLLNPGEEITREIIELALSLEGAGVQLQGLIGPEKRISIIKG